LGAAVFAARYADLPVRIARAGKLARLLAN